MTHVTQKENWGYRDVWSDSRLGGVLGTDSHIFLFPAEETSPDREEGMNLSPNLLGPTLAASLQDRFRDVVSNIIKVSKYEESKALYCDSGCPLHFETVRLHLSLSGKPTKRELQ